jgi:curved DNA-binding protein
LFARCAVGGIRYAYDLDHRTGEESKAAPYHSLRKACASMAERDYYEVLGVSREATPDQIKKAYRGMARKYHPDVNPGDKTAETKFKEAQQAYDVLSESEKRSLYDRYGTAAFQGGGPAGARSGASEWAARQAGPGFENIDLTDLFGPGGMAGGMGGEGVDSGGLFEDLIGRVRGGRGSRRSGPRPARTIEATLAIPFLTAVRGGETTIDIQRDGGGHETLAVKIPPGVESGAKLRLRGRGEPGQHGAPSGDLLITVEAEPHPYFQRLGRDLSVEVPITIGEAVLGAKIEVPTLVGQKTLTVPPGSSSGQKLRLRGEGVPGTAKHPPGDLFVILKNVVPKKFDDESRDLIQKFSERNPMRPRDGLW